LSFTDPENDVTVRFDSSCFSADTSTYSYQFNDEIQQLSTTDWSSQTPNQIIASVNTVVQTTTSLIGSVIATNCEAVQTVEQNSANLQG